MRVLLLANEEEFAAASILSPASVLADILVKRFSEMTELSAFSHLLTSSAYIRAVATLAKVGCTIYPREMDAVESAVMAADEVFVLAPPNGQTMIMPVTETRCVQWNANR